MKKLSPPSGNRRHARNAAVFLCAVVALEVLGGCSKAPPQVDQKAVMGDEKSLAVYKRFGWELVSSQRQDETTTTYLFKRPENFTQSVQDTVAEAREEAMDKTRLANKELTEIEKTDGSK